MDDVLPIPTPDWDNPQPYDGPTPEETEMFRQLQAAADGIRARVTGAYVQGTTPDAWNGLGDRIVAVGQECVDLSRTVRGEVESSAGLSAQNSRNSSDSMPRNAS